MKATQEISTLIARAMSEAESDGTYGSSVPGRQARVMIKIIAIGLWVCVVTLASSYVMASMQGSGGPEGEGASRPRAISRPRLQEDRLDHRSDHRRRQGPGLCPRNFVYTIDGRTGLVPCPCRTDPFILDEAYRAVYSTSTSTSSIPSASISPP